MIGGLTWYVDLANYWTAYWTITAIQNHSFDFDML
jgi:hypothetical protein